MSIRPLRSPSRGNLIGQVSPLPTILDSGEHLEITSVVNAAHDRTAQRNDVVNFVSDACLARQTGCLLVDGSDRSLVRPWRSRSNLHSLPLGGVSDHVMMVAPPPFRLHSYDSIAMLLTVRALLLAACGVLGELLDTVRRSVRQIVRALACDISRRCSVGLVPGQPPFSVCEMVLLAGRASLFAIRKVIRLSLGSLFLSMFSATGSRLLAMIRLIGSLSSVQPFSMSRRVRPASGVDFFSMRRNIDLALPAEFVFVREFVGARQFALAFGSFVAGHAEDYTAGYRCSLN
jgi:hypothetical protein